MEWAVDAYHSIVPGGGPTARTGSSIFGEAHTLVAFEVGEDLKGAMGQERATWDQLLRRGQRYLIIVPLLQVRVPLLQDQLLRRGQRDRMRRGQD